MSFRTNANNLFVVAVSVAFGMIPLVSPAFFHNMPHELQPPLESGILLSALGSADGAQREAAATASAAQPGVFENVSFTLHRGEVLGLAGMLGAGRSEVLRAIFGADPFASGSIVFNGSHVKRPTPRAMKRLGLGFTPENRKEAGLVQVLSIHDNLCLASLDVIGPHGFITRSMERPYVARQIAGLSVRTSDPNLPVSSLSGGNQQKIVIGNWLNTAPRALFLDEPSRGIDVRAKQQIFQIIWAQAERGVAAMFVSTELEELIEVCDRIIVLHHGRLIAEVRPEETTLADLYRLCMEGAA